MNRQIYIKNKLVEVQYKSFSFSTKADSFSEDDNFFYFEGYASTFGNTDMGNDVVVAGAFKKSLAKKMPKMVYQHDMRQPLGVWVSAVEDGHGLFVRGKMPKSSSLAQEVYSMMKCGAIDSMSIGFSLDKSSSFSIEDEKRYLKEINLWEISPVTIPMNSDAKITQVKAKTKAEDDDVDENDLEDAEDDQEDDDDMDDDSDDGDDEDEEMGKRGKPKKKKCYDLDAVKHVKSKREFESLLRESGVFTKAASIRLAGLINQKQSESVDDLNKKTIDHKDVNKLKELLNTI